LKDNNENLNRVRKQRQLNDQRREFDNSKYDPNPSSFYSFRKPDLLSNELELELKNNEIEKLNKEIKDLKKQVNEMYGDLEKYENDFQIFERKYILKENELKDKIKILEMEVRINI
jgi:hypothetical protein